jgi:phosphohistidine phosphatase
VTRTLYLLRHAKSAWDDPSLADSERPLAPRGRAASATIADYIRDHAIAPEVVICSPAVRARQTLEGLGDALGTARVEIEPSLYDANETDLLERARKLAPDVASAMMVGHNPSIQRFALLIAEESERLDQLRQKFPTAALATLAVDTADWHELRAGDAALTGFVKPRDLA